MTIKTLQENTFYHTKHTTYLFLFTVSYEYSTLAILQDIHDKSRLAIEMNDFIQLIEVGSFRLEERVR